MEKCGDCRKWFAEYEKDVFCDACPDGRPDNSAFNFSNVEKVKLVSMTVTRKQIGELERRAILPDKRADGGYYLGRRMENGKISDRQPDYRG